MIILSLSGGGVKGIAQRGFNDTIRKHGVTFDVTMGVSIGAANAAFEAMGIEDQATKLFLNINDNLLWGGWKYKPQSLPGVFRGIKSIKTGTKPYLGVMKGYERNLRNLITLRVFETYKQNPKTAPCYVLAVRSDGEPKFWNLKELKYEKAIKAIIASGSIPLATPPVEIDGHYYWDGGLISHSPADFILPYLKKKGIIPNQLITHFTRPKNGAMSEKNLMNMGLPEAFMQMISIYNKNTTLEDEEDENEFCIANNVDYYPIYTKYFAKGFYDTSKQTAKKGYQIGKEAAHKYYLNKI